MWTNVTLIVMALSLAGCGGKSAVRVIDDETGQPIAGVRVTPILADFWSFGSPYYARAVVTGPLGQVTFPYSEKRIHGFDVTHRNYREIRPRDKPWRDGNVHLYYMRRPPRVVLLVPEGFTGPVVVTGMTSGRHLPREPLYEITLGQDHDLPIPVPGLQDGLVAIEELEAKRGSESIVPAPNDPDHAIVHVWIPSYRWGFFYEDDYVDILYIGTKPGFDAFERTLRSLGLKPPQHLTRQQLDRLRVAARAAETD